MTLTHLTGRDVLDRADELTDAYVEVFTSPPWQHPEPARLASEFRDRLSTDVHRPGFRAVLALVEDGTVDGFATAWTTQAAFRTDRAYGRVITRLGHQRVAELLVGALEVDELGVRARARGTGLGRRLLDAVTTDPPRGQAWLLTWSGARDTIALYRARGWTEPPPQPGARTDVIVFIAPQR